jgi:CRP-like cAMP-binding protein
VSEALVHLLHEDPGLAEGLEGPRREAALRECLCQVLEVPTGPWDHEAVPHDSPGDLGLVVLSGFIVRRVTIGTARGAELLGAGDLIRPWQDGGEHSILPASAHLVVVEPARLALLDARAALRLARYPEVISELLGRAMMRSRSLAAHLAVSQMPRVDRRLVVLFWHLADRYGRVTPDGILLDLPLSHELLSWLVAARRPAVTTALTRLAERDVLRRRPDGRWLLDPEPPEWLDEQHAHAPTASSS